MTALLAAVLALQSITVSMTGAPASAIVPGSLIRIHGQHWSDTVSMSAMGDAVLGGYAVTVGGAVCPLTYVGPEEISCLAPLAPYGTQTLILSGPVWAFSTTVEVIGAYPVIRESGGFAVASASPSFFPQLYQSGEPIPVSPAGYRLVGIHATGIQTGDDVTVTLDGPEHYSLEGKAAWIPGYHGVMNVYFFAPPCANGTYSVRFTVRGVESPPSLIRFSSECSVRRVEGFSRPRVVR